METKNRPEGRFRRFPKHSAECSGAGCGAETGVESGDAKPYKQMELGALHLIKVLNKVLSSHPENESDTRNTAMRYPRPHG